MRSQKNFKNSLNLAQRKSSTSRRARKRVVDARGSCKRSRFSKYCSKQELSDKLEALKSLIPHPHVQNGIDEKVKAEQLFQETADYIIVLKTQVLVLQKLIEFYGNIDYGSTNLKQNHVLEHKS